MNNNRYSRHVLLEDFGQKGQEKLSKSSVLILGLGGLGSPISVQLASSGIGRIGLLDFDEVELSNLQRQILYNEEDVGKKKTLCAKKHLEKLNSNIQYIVYDELLKSEKTAKEIFEKFDIIICAFDQIKDKYFAQKIATSINKCIIIGSAQNYLAQIICVPNNECASLIDAFGDLSVEEDLQINKIQKPKEIIGVFAPVCSFCASIIASETIKYLIDENSIMKNQLLQFDAKTSCLRKINIKKHK